MSNLAIGRVILKFNYSVLVQKSFSLLNSNFILNLHIVYKFDNWPRNPTSNFPLKKYLLGTVKLIRNIIKSKFIYFGQGIAFYREGSWSFDNKFARSVVIRAVDNSSSSHTDNKKKKKLFSVNVQDQLLVLIVAMLQQKKNRFNFSKANTKFA